MWAGPYARRGLASALRRVSEDDGPRRRCYSQLFTTGAGDAPKHFGAAVTGPRTKDQLILLDDQYGCITRIAHPLAREAAFEDSCSCFSHRRLRCRAAQITFRLFILEEEKYAWPPMHWLGLGVVLQNCTWFSVLGRGDHRATRRLRVCGCIEFCAYTVNFPFRV